INDNKILREKTTFYIKIYLKLMDVGDRHMAWEGLPCIEAVRALSCHVQSFKTKKGSNPYAQK
ncbi:hypothetical protein, partial [Bacillus paramycoides]|uniref:hypothetical protein n=1 Tax=Bacillus paramycoides TaxID=2026194 RepID=UPI001ABFA16C